jgi:prepilin-type N-terminal cleavage/methylation domain-containing protein
MVAMSAPMSQLRAELIRDTVSARLARLAWPTRCSLVYIAIILLMLKYSKKTSSRAIYSWYYVGINKRGASMQRSSEKQAGFTLLEVLVVIVAIIILAAIIYFN